MTRHLVQSALTSEQTDKVKLYYIASYLKENAVLGLMSIFNFDSKQLEKKHIAIAVFGKAHFKRNLTQALQSGDIVNYYFNYLEKHKL